MNIELIIGSFLHSGNYKIYCKNRHFSVCL